jgi:hypothetical protein
LRRLNALSDRRQSATPPDSAVAGTGARWGLDCLQRSFDANRKHDYPGDHRQVQVGIGVAGEAISIALIAANRITRTRPSSVFAVLPSHASPDQANHSTASSALLPLDRRFQQIARDRSRRGDRSRLVILSAINGDPGGAAAQAHRGDHLVRFTCTR